MDLLFKVPIIVINDLKKSFYDKLSSKEYDSFSIDEYLKKLKNQNLYRAQLRHNFDICSDLPVAYYEDLFPIYVIQLRNEDSKTLDIKTQNGKTISIKVNLLFEVHEVKSLIEKMEGIPPDQQRLIYKGKQLFDYLTLADYQIADNDELLLILRLRGGGCRPPLFADVSNQNAFVDSQFTRTGPDWHIVRKGLNLEGFCRNLSCVAAKKNVVCPMPHAVFDLIADRDKVKCPMCRENVEPITCGFTDCSYTFEGIKVENNSLVKFQQDSPIWVGHFYRNYNPEDSGVVEWKSLKILTKIEGYLKGLSTFCFYCLESKKSQSSEKFCRANCGHIYHEHCRSKINIDFASCCLICDKKI